MTTDETQVLDVSSLGIDFDAFDLASNPLSYLRDGSITMDLETPTMFKGSIEGQPVECIATLREGALVRMTEMHNERADGEGVYVAVSTNIRPAKIDLSVRIDGAEGSLEEFFLAIVNAGVADPQKRLTLERFLAICDGMNYLNNNMFMLTQHMGCDAERVKAEFAWFESLGAVDVTDTIADPRRIVRVLEMPRDVPAPKLTSITVDRADRSASITGQGFQDLLDAQFTSFRRAQTLRRRVRELDAQIQSAEADGLNQETVRKLIADRDLARTLSQTWIGNWGGVQEQHEVHADGARVPNGRFAPTSIPSGRMSLVSEDGTPHDYDVWMPRTGGRGATAPVTDTRSAAEQGGNVVGDTEEPF